jgi:hypothetical protein
MVTSRKSSVLYWLAILFVVIACSALLTLFLQKQAAQNAKPPAGAMLVWAQNYEGENDHGFGS